MTTFRCWLKFHHEESDAHEITAPSAYDPDDAAVDAVEHWHEHGAWSGDPIPHSIEVFVRNATTNELFEVEVTPSWDVSFYGSKPKLVEEPAKTA